LAFHHGVEEVSFFSVNAAIGCMSVWLNDLVRFYSHYFGIQSYNFVELQWYGIVFYGTKFPIPKNRCNHSLFLCVLGPFIGSHSLNLTFILPYSEVRHEKVSLHFMLMHMNQLSGGSYSLEIFNVSVLHMWILLDASSDCFIPYLFTPRTTNKIILLMTIYCECVFYVCLW
jgi:hypothetical protein